MLLSTEALDVVQVYFDYLKFNGKFTALDWACLTSLSFSSISTKFSKKPYIDIMTSIYCEQKNNTFKERMGLKKSMKKTLRIRCIDG